MRCGPGAPGSSAPWGAQRCSVEAPVQFCRCLWGTDGGGVRVTPDCGVWGAQVTLTPPLGVLVIGDGVPALCNTGAEGERTAGPGFIPTPDHEKDAAEG